MKLRQQILEQLQRRRVRHVQVVEQGSNGNGELGNCEQREF
jgi:hypothetical protein